MKGKRKKSLAPKGDIEVHENNGGKEARAENEGDTAFRIVFLLTLEYLDVAFLWIVFWLVPLCQSRTFLALFVAFLFCFLLPASLAVFCARQEVEHVLGEQEFLLHSLDLETSFFDKVASAFARDLLDLFTFGASAAFSLMADLCALVETCLEALRALAFAGEVLIDFGFVYSLPAKQRKLHAFAEAPPLGDHCALRANSYVASFGTADMFTGPLLDARLLALVAIVHSIFVDAFLSFLRHPQYMVSLSAQLLVDAYHVALQLTIVVSAVKKITARRIARKLLWSVALLLERVVLAFAHPLHFDGARWTLHLFHLHSFSRAVLFVHQKTPF